MGPFVAHQPDLISVSDSAWLVYKILQFLSGGKNILRRNGGGYLDAKFLDQFYLNFIKDDRWKYLTDGLKTTLLITFLQ